MSLKTKVKVGKIKHLSEARYCAGMGVDLLGFQIGMEQNPLSFNEFEEIAGWVVGPEWVLELPPTPDWDTLDRVLQSSLIKHIQLRPYQWDVVAKQHCKHSLILSVDRAECKNLLTTIGDAPVSHVIVCPSADEPESYWENIGYINDAFPVLAAYNPDRMDMVSLLSKPISGLSLERHEKGGSDHEEYGMLPTVLSALETP